MKPLLEMAARLGVKVVLLALMAAAVMAAGNASNTTEEPEETVTVRADTKGQEGQEEEEAVFFLLLSYALKAAVTPGVSGDHGLCPLCHSCIVRSADNGKTWSLAAVAQPGSRESSLAAFTQPGEGGAAHTPSRLYVSERNMGHDIGHRMQSWSEDSGSTLLSESVNSDLPEPVTANWTGVVGSVLALPVQTLTSSGGGVQRLVYSGPASSTSRSNISLFVSRDSGLSWDRRVVVHTGPSGYSDMATLDSETGAILFENGQRGHTNSFAEKITLKTFRFEQL